MGKEDRTMRRLLLLPAGLAAGLVLGRGAAVSQPPGTPGAAGLPAGVEVDRAAAANPFPLSPAAGEWLVCAAHYAGADAPELARQVALDLRNRHRLNAFIFNHAAHRRQEQEEEFKKLQERYPGVPIKRRFVRVQEECAVLVGGFRDFEDASGSLKRVKGLPLPELSLGEGKSAYDFLNLYEPDPERKGTTVKRAKVNPYSNAMVVRNPLVAAAPKPEVKFDPLWKKFNENEPYSLLKCRARYTLVVKEYAGAAIVPASGGSTGLLSMLGLGKGEQLSAAGMQAQKLAEFLGDRRLGFKAYVLHTRTNSIVTVGEFNDLKDPELQRLQQRVAALKFSNNPTGAGSDPIGLMASPIPMEVPRER
jgi:hypothetical protein